jgi:hypothetical protein
MTMKSNFPQIFVNEFNKQLYVLSRNKFFRFKDDYYIFFVYIFVHFEVKKIKYLKMKKIINLSHQWVLTKYQEQRSIRNNFL